MLTDELFKIDAGIHVFLQVLEDALRLFGTRFTPANIILSVEDTLRRSRSRMRIRLTFS